MNKNTKNTVELLGHYGSDRVIACSAWTSTSRNLSEEKIARIPNLIDMLWKDGHHTPFEKGDVHFLINCDIATHIHLIKHRMASANSESARYKELKEDKYYLPEDWTNICLSQNIGPMHFPWLTTQQSWVDILEGYTKMGNELYHKCLSDLTPILGRKRAKESARFFKTYNSQIQADVKFNMRSFANFLSLRRSEHAQKEICEIADGMLKLVRQIDQNPFEHTLIAWEKYGVIK